MDELITTEYGWPIRYYDWREDVAHFLERYKQLKIYVACYQPKEDDECPTE